ncbi:FAD-dependent oxidoreductase [Brevundimonas balnearis]|uniref:Thioredoxin reductase n=1 Tax=Brevundimonas balnearis TaxID=1572858 RepID=A0ABV6R2B8_9CAUL
MAKRTRSEATMTDQATEPLDAADPYAREAQTFPVLPEEMAERIASYGAPETLDDGTLVFERGQRSVDFFLVLDGAIEIYDLDERGQPHVFTVHGPRQFTGEVDLFNDRQILVSGRTRGATRVVRLKRDVFRRMIAAEADIGEILMRAFILRRVGLMRHAQGGVVLVGSGHDGETSRIQSFLERNGYPLRLIDRETDADASSFLEGFHLKAEQLPVVLADGQLLFNPSDAELADRLGISIEIDPEHVHDVAVVGGGPGGLAAAVYAASEGLDTIVLETFAPGGQAGTSSKIENYLGFPTGISGQALAGRALTQAQKFGARVAVSRSVKRLHCDQSPYRVELDDGRRVSARAVVVATGARYRRLEIEGSERFDGRGLHYAATAVEARLCRSEEVIVVGGGNSAGQAAVFLSRSAGHVHVLVRGEGLAATMSRYLIERIDASSRITLHAHTEITALEGDPALERVTWRHRQTGESETKEIGNVFVMIGAQPNTGWLDGCLDLDAKGFIVCGDPASPYSTSRPGVFAVGDVRSGSVKRVASAVGEGSVAVQAVHRFLDPVAD